MIFSPTTQTTNGAIYLPARRVHSIMVKMDTLECEPVAQAVMVRSGSVDTVRFRLLTPQHQAVARTDRTPPLSIPAPQPEPLSPVVMPQAQPTSSRPDTLPRNMNRILYEAQPLESDTETPVVMPPADTAQEPQAEGGVIEVNSAVAGATILIDGVEQEHRTPDSVHLPFGEHSVRVKLEGYEFSPPDQRVTITSQAPYKSVSFAVAPPSADKGMGIQTTPVVGPIYVDGVQQGEGNAFVTRDFGVYTVTFGDIEGWQTPAPVRVSITPSQPKADIKGVYSRTLSFSAEATQRGDAVTDGNIRWDGGVFFEETGPQRSSALGPKIKRIPGSGKYGWEIGVGDPSRNPMGGDYLEFTISLPADVDPKAAHSLKLYLYRSARAYPLVLTAGRSELTVLVNGRIFLDGYRPQYGAEDADAGRFEEWPLTGFLKAGDNRIIIRAGDRNSMYNFLWKIELQ